MEVPSDALTVFVQGQVGDALVEAGVLDRDSGCDGEARDQLLVELGELRPCGLLGEVEVPEHLTTDEDRHPEERGHVGVVGWEPRRFRVSRQVGQAQRSRVDDEDAEDAVTFGQVADLAVGLVVDAHRQELGQPRARRVEHAESAVARIDEVRGQLDDARQGLGEVEARSDGDDRVEQLPQTVRFHARHDGHSTDEQARRSCGRRGALCR